MSAHPQNLRPASSREISRARLGADEWLPPEAHEFARVAAEAGLPVLITGETGVGKTHLARIIHSLGARSRGPFVRVNCASIPESLFERELFGHVRGAFTDARESGSGLLAEADSGTLFLDEIGEMPLTGQPKLLAVLEDGVFRRVGSPREERANVHLIAATNRDLGEMVEQKLFRVDLFYRLSVLQHRIPPLRERPDEIPRFVRQLLRSHCPAHPCPTVSPAALRLLMRYPWPGNIRELQNVLRRAAAFARGATIEPVHLPGELSQETGAVVAAPREHPGLPRRYQAPTEPHEERSRIVAALNATAGNRTRAAEFLGMSRSTLWTKLQRYQIDFAVPDGRDL